MNIPYKQWVRYHNKYTFEGTPDEFSRIIEDINNEYMYNQMDPNIQQDVNNEVADQHIILKMEN